MTTPTSFDERAFRYALGRFATGVTIVTCNGPDGPMGITANSFASLSLDPPLVLWSPAKSSRRYDAFVNAPEFAIHVASYDQLDLCRDFAKSAGGSKDTEWKNLRLDARICRLVSRASCVNNTQLLMEVTIP